MPGGNAKGCRRMVKYGDEFNKQVIAIVDTNCSIYIGQGETVLPRRSDLSVN